MDQENSVAIAISELQKLEQQRLQDEAKAKERERIESAQARALQRAEQERARRLAEQETRERIASDLRRRNAEVEARIVSLRAELAAVQAARQEIRLRLLAGYPTRITEIRHSRLGLKLACALAACCAVTLFGVHFFSPLGSRTGENESEHFELREESNRLEQPVTVYPINKTDNNADAQPPAPRPDTVEQKTQDSKKFNGKPQTNSKPCPSKTKNPRTSGDLLSDLDKCGDDPTCGLPVLKNNRNISR